MPRLLLLVLVLTGFVWTTPAVAATVAQPADGIQAAQGSTVFFDWAWDSDEYATASIVFTRKSDPAAAEWTYGNGTTAVDANERRIFTDRGFAYTSSNANLFFDAMPQGLWYWRLCNKSINGEDDKCSYDSGVAPRALMIVDGPDCNDGFNNDGDGYIDYPADKGCTSNDDPDETNPACVDGTDNDGDGKIDYSRDPGCSGFDDNDEFNVSPACDDGIDNDRDGAVDYLDANCENALDNDENAPPVPLTLASSTATTAARSALAAKYASWRRGSQKSTRYTRTSTLAGTVVARWRYKSRWRTQKVAITRSTAGIKAQPIGRVRTLKSRPALR